MSLAARTGTCRPGATVQDDGTSFSLFSRGATGVQLLFFDCVEDARPSSVVPLSPATNRTYHYWHVFVPGVRPGQLYGYRVEGPHDPGRGLRFDPAKVLLDPYGRGVAEPPGYDREAAKRPGDNTAVALKSVVVDNFVTCHDGFTLNDLVSYDHKHNEANGEDNRDGANDNQSWNCGVEGPTDDPQVEALRNRQVKNFLTVTVISLGVPMILMGDEVRHSQGGNNNAYCQDSEISWFDWTRPGKCADVHRFVKLLIERRLLRTVEHERQRRSLTEMLEQATKAWHGVKLLQPDWSDQSHSVALGAELRREGLHFHLILNGYWEPLAFELPQLPAGSSWRRWIDTALASSEDIVPWQTAPAVPGTKYRVESRSVVMLFADGQGLSDREYQFVAEGQSQ